jgi:hypothetical protein
MHTVHILHHKGLQKTDASHGHDKTYSESGEGEHDRDEHASGALPGAIPD